MSSTSAPASPPSSTSTGNSFGQGGSGGGSTPLSVFPTSVRKRQANSTNTTSSTSSPSSTPLLGNASTFPAPFLLFALAAIALFVIVVAFVLLRICMRNRRLRRMGIVPDGPMDRFFAAGGSSGDGFRGFRGEIEDTLEAPKLWQAKVVLQDGSAIHSGSYGEKGGWENLMPVAASLPTSLYTTLHIDDLDDPGTATQAAVMASANRRQNKKNKKKKATDEDSPIPTAADASGDEAGRLDEKVSGSVNVSVLIAMPSPPKDDGEELPELMLGTAAVPIYSRLKQQQQAGQQASRPGSSSGASTAGYFDAPAVLAPTTDHPTRADLLALFQAARANKNQDGAAALKRTLSNRSRSGESRDTATTVAGPGQTGGAASSDPLSSPGPAENSHPLAMYGVRQASREETAAAAARGRESQL